MMIVDRIIGGIAVCESDGVLLELPLAEICGDVCEGAVLSANSEGFTVDQGETDRRRVMLAERFRRIAGQKL